MAGSDGAILLATARWSDEHKYLQEVVKGGHLPQMVRFVKGHYLGLGSASLANPNLSSTAVVTSAGPCVRVAVQCVKFKDNHRTVNVGPKLAIPESFDGYFEILNEDGKAVKCIESVAELVRKFPDSCLVRENIKGYVSRSDDVDAIMERSRTIAAGELLVLVGQVHGVSGGGGPQRNAGGRGTSSAARFLRCFDGRGEHVYLPMDARGKFSPVAKEDNISGVHNIRNLLNKRLPLMVRMVSGKPPQGLKLGQQFTHEMRLLARFEEDMIVALPVIKSEHLPAVLIPPSVSLKLQLPANSHSIKQSKEFLRLHDRCLTKYHQLADLIQVYDANFSKNLRFDGQQWRVPVVPLLRRSTSDLLNPNVNTDAKTLSIKEPLIESDSEYTATSPIPPEYDEIDQIYDYIRGFAPLPKHIRNSYDLLNGNHVDNRNLYNYSSAKEASRYGVSGKRSAGVKPPPPPLETIPSRKVAASPSSPSAEKNKTEPSDSAASDHPAVVVRTSPVPTRYSVAPLRKTISHPAETEATPASTTPEATATATAATEPVSTPVATPKPRIFRQRSSIPMKNGHYGKSSANNGQSSHHPLPAVLLSPAESKQSLTPSPLFNIRYKSMTNLLAADSDTLGSSQSGGRCSGGSAGSAAVRSPPHYVQRPSNQHHHHHHHHHYVHPAGPLGHLHRPRSLTDLLWDVRSGKSPPKIQLHPTVVADVIPSSTSSSRHHGSGALYVNRSAKHELIIRRRNSANLLNHGGGTTTSTSVATSTGHSKKQQHGNTIFYHL